MQATQSLFSQQQDGHRLSGKRKITLERQDLKKDWDQIRNLMTMRSGQLLDWPELMLRVDSIQTVHFDEKSELMPAFILLVCKHCEVVIKYRPAEVALRKTSWDPPSWGLSSKKLDKEKD